MNSEKFRMAEQCCQDVRVYAATDTKEGTPVALKVFLPLTNQRTVVGERFVKRTLSAIPSSHPAIVPIADSGETPEGLPYFVMERLEGVTVEADIESRGALPLSRALFIAKAMFEGLAAAHSEGCVHRNINPANIFLVDPESAQPDVRILDFGVAQDLVDYLAIAPSALGHTRYLAPELLLYADKAWTPAVDVFAAGMVLFLMLTGRLPFDKEDYVESGKNTIRSYAALFKLPGPAKFAPHVPPAIDAVVQVSLAIEQQDRFKNVGKMLQAFESALSSVDLEQGERDGEAPQQRLVTEEEWHREAGTDDDPTLSRDSSAASNTSAEPRPSEGQFQTESAQPTGGGEANDVVRAYIDLYSSDVPPLPIDGAEKHDPTKKMTLPEVNEEETELSVFSLSAPDESLNPALPAKSETSDVPRFLGSPSEELLADGSSDEHPDGLDTELDVTLCERESFEEPNDASTDIAPMIDAVVRGEFDTEIDVGADSPEFLSDQEFEDVFTEAMKVLKMPKRKVSRGSPPKQERDDVMVKVRSEDLEAPLESPTEQRHNEVTMEIPPEDPQSPPSSEGSSSLPLEPTHTPSKQMIPTGASHFEVESRGRLVTVDVEDHFPELRRRKILIKAGIAVLACIVLLIVLFSLPRTW